MKKRLNILYMIGFFLMQLVWVGCEEEELLAPSFPEGEGIEEGMVSIVLRPSAGNEVITRANESGNLGEEEAIEYVTLLLFDNADGLTDDESRSLLTFANQQLVEQNNRISLYLQARKQILYAICNYPDTAELKNIRNLEELKALSTTITRKDGAYTGRYILEGMVDITPSGTPEQIASAYTIEVQRIAAAFSFNIRFDPTHEDDKFEISGVYIHNIPKGSYLLNRNKAETDTLNLCTGDYVYAATDEDRKQRYFWGDSLRLDLTAYTDDRKRTGYKASFMQFENRQGGVDDASGAWESLAGLKGQTVNGMDAYEYYRQIYKRDIAEGKIEATKAFTAPYASYLTIHGIYRVATGTPFKVVYYLYLGADNYKDFNVRRNYSYNHEVVIRSKEEIQDSRVEAQSLGSLEIYGEFTEKILDAHCNASQVLMYANGGWSVEVENPDQTPWLEVSQSPNYLPRMAGENETGKAAFRIQGSGGLQYFYIHTDEFVPQEADPKDNKDVYREGTIVCRSGNAEKRCTVKQYAAQMVICHIRYDIHTMKEIADTFYVERLLEKKNMTWGFHQYWSFITDDLIAAGQWDGLANTRRLYDVGLNGDKWEIEPAYPSTAYPDGIPVDIALGYAVNKNRDRNGNGKIDYEEIVWYLPAANELQALSGHIHGSGEYYEETWNHTVTWTEETGNYHSSSPSVADPSGITTGRSYFVNLANGKKQIGLRTRKYNVICVRRKNAWMGNNTAFIEGKFDNDPEWEGEEEEIMPKPQQ